MAITMRAQLTLPDLNTSAEEVVIFPTPSHTHTRTHALHTQGSSCGRSSITKCRTSYDRFDSPPTKAEGLRALSAGAWIRQ